MHLPTDPAVLFKDVFLKDDLKVFQLLTGDDLLSLSETK
jgi:hypothetical protein